MDIRMKTGGRRAVWLAVLCFALVAMHATANAQPAESADVDAGNSRLVYMGGSLTPEEVAKLHELAPALQIVQPESAEEALRLAPKAHGMDARFATPEVISAAKQLVWVQSPSAGVERYLRIDELRESDRIVMTNMQGVHAATIAEHSFAMLLTLTRDLRYYTQESNRGTWNNNGSGAQPIALHGRTLLVVGLGGIGSEVAKIGKGFGMRVLATKRRQTDVPEYVDKQGTPGDLAAFLSEADVVALCVPLTDETRAMISEKEFSAMKAGSYIINVGRGPVIDTDALVAALRSGHLAGACLDVTDPEPLPPGHPLWMMENVVITPHTSSRSPLTTAVWKETYMENIRRFGKGEPLLNVVDKDAGY